MRGNGTYGTDRTDETGNFCRTEESCGGGTVQEGIGIRRGAATTAAEAEPPLGTAAATTEESDGARACGGYQGGDGHRPPLQLQ